MLPYSHSEGTLMFRYQRIQDDTFEIEGARTDRIIKNMGAFFMYSLQFVEFIYFVLGYGIQSYIMNKISQKVVLQTLPVSWACCKQDCNIYQRIWN